MGILSWIILGGIAGWLASMIVGNNKEQGVIGNIFVGIIGAFIGGFVLHFITGDEHKVTDFSLSSLLVALLGAVILLWLLKLLRGRSSNA